MARWIGKTTFILSFLIAMGQPVWAEDSLRVFLRSAGYGVLAGMGVGVASLVFSENPAGNLNNVARGASYGLWGGSLVGWYLIETGRTQSSQDDYTALQIIPVLSRQSLDGVYVQMNVIGF